MRQINNTFIDGFRRRRGRLLRQPIGTVLDYMASKPMDLVLQVFQLAIVIVTI
ncbi:MAG: hypothetical protein ACQESY_08625 [Pseudomonadota bacterium]